MRARAYGPAVEVWWTDECGLVDHLLVAWSGRTPEAWLRRADLVICPATPDDAWRRAGEALSALPGAFAAIAGGLVRFRDHRYVPGPSPGTAGPPIADWHRHSGDGSAERPVSAAIAAIRESTRCALRSLDLL